MAQADPAKATEQPYKAVVENDRARLASLLDHAPDLVKGVGEAYEGIRVEAFEQVVRQFFATVTRPTLGMPYTEVGYRPMRELLALLDRAPVRRCPPAQLGRRHPELLLVYRRRAASWCEWHGTPGEAFANGMGSGNLGQPGRSALAHQDEFAAWAERQRAAVAGAQRRGDRVRPAAVARSRVGVLLRWRCGPGAAGRPWLTARNLGLFGR